MGSAFLAHKNTPAQLNNHNRKYIIFERETVLRHLLPIFIHLRLVLLCNIAIEIIINLFISLRMIEWSVNNELERMPLTCRHYHRIFLEGLRKTLKSLVRKAGLRTETRPPNLPNMKRMAATFGEILLNETKCVYCSVRKVTAFV
jgi:hypothetical protein